MSGRSATYSALVLLYSVSQSTLSLHRQSISQLFVSTGPLWWTALLGNISSLRRRRPLRRIRCMRRQISLEFWFAVRLQAQPSSVVIFTNSVSLPWSEQNEFAASKMELQCSQKRHLMVELNFCSLFELQQLAVYLQPCSSCTQLSRCHRYHDPYRRGKNSCWLFLSNLFLISKTIFKNLCDFQYCRMKTDSSTLWIYT